MTEILDQIMEHNLILDGMAPYNIWLNEELSPTEYVGHYKGVQVRTTPACHGVTATTYTKNGWLEFYFNGSKPYLIKQFYDDSREVIFYYD